MYMISMCKLHSMFRKLKWLQRQENDDDDGKNKLSDPCPKSACKINGGWNPCGRDINQKVAILWNVMLYHWMSSTTILKGHRAFIFTVKKSQENPLRFDIIQFDRQVPTFLHSTSAYLTKYTASYPSSPNFNINHCYNIKSQKQSIFSAWKRKCVTWRRTKSSHGLKYE